jgi:hypothetical protein
VAKLGQEVAQVIMPDTKKDLVLTKLSKTVSQDFANDNSEEEKLPEPRLISQASFKTHEEIKTLEYNYAVEQSQMLNFA